MHATETREMPRQQRVERLMNAVYATSGYRHLADRAHRARQTVADAVDDNARSVQRTVRRRMVQAQDAVDEFGLRVRRKPVRSVGIAFAAGAAVGAIAARAALALARHD